MMKSLARVLDKYADAFRDLINEKRFSSSGKIKELLRLNKEEDWGFICAAMDIIEDASLAIDNFLRFGLEGPTKYEETGERYLRLYGVLNSTYIQQEAILKLYKLMNAPNFKEAKSKLVSLRVRKVRNKVGAHSCHHINEDKVESFVPVRIALSHFNLEYINNQNLVIERVDLKEILTEHLKLMIELLDRILEKAMKTLYKSNKKKQDELNAKLQDLRLVKDGKGVVIDLPDGGKIVIHTMGNEI